MNKSEVKNIAKLARLELNDEELERYADQLSEILEYVNKLEEVDTEKVEITAQVTGLVNVLRDDEVETCDKIEQLLEQVPEVEDGGVKVKSVF